MRIRIRFQKTGPIRFVGHLDFMRTFQKGIKKSGLAAVYSAGFSPHMLISFAAPLAIGEEALGDYADCDFAYRDAAGITEQEAYRLKDIGLDNDALPLPPSEAEITAALNEAMPEGIRALSAVRVGLIKGSKAMALVRFAKSALPLDDAFLSGISPEELNRQIAAFLAQDTIMVHKKTKKSERDVDIRPLIVSMKAMELPEYAEELVPEEYSRLIELVCASGSSQNLKPQAVMEAFCSFLHTEYDPFGFRMIRMELYDENMKTLEELGSPLISQE